VARGGRDPLVTAKLSDEQLDLLRRSGDVRPTVVGQVLFREGDASYDLVVVLAGTVAIVDGYGAAERPIGLVDPGGLIGDLGLLTGERPYVTAVVRESGSVLVVPVAELKRLVGQSALGDFLLQVFVRRRMTLMSLQTGLQIFGSRSSPDTQRLRQFAARNRIAHTWIDLDDQTAERVLRGLGGDPARAPVVVLRGGEMLNNPTNAALAQALGLRIDAPRTDGYDVVVVGGGPAGLAVSIYVASGGLSTAILEAVAPGGQAGTSPRIENYPGFPAGLSGTELTERAVVQAEKFGTHLLVPCEAIGLGERNGDHAVQLADGREVLGRAVVVATGVAYRSLDVPGLHEFEGIGVFYTPPDVGDQIDPDAGVVIVGGGNSAGQAALSFAGDGHRVFLVVRGDTLSTSMSRYLIDRIEHQPAVEVLLRTEVRELEGTGQLERVVVEDTRTGRRRSLDAGRVLVLIGSEPHTQWLREAVELDGGGYVLTGPEVSRRLLSGPPWSALGRAPFLFETSRPGVFAIGDVRSGSFKRVTSAIGEGSMSASLIAQYLAGTPVPGSTAVAVR
jgi:thioredoxin reductase (NADPH)